MKYLTNTYLLIFLLILLLIVDLLLGTINIFDTHINVYSLLIQLRIPRVLTAMSVGSILSMSGLVLQILFRNSLAGPYVLGISGAASLFAAIATMGTGMFVGYNILYNMELSIFSIIGALMGLVIILMILRVTSQITVILIVGLMLSQLYAAVQSILSYLSNEHALKIYTLWTMGSIQNTNIYHALGLVVLGFIGMIGILRYTKKLMVYIVGDEFAQVMGIDIKKLKRQLIVIVAMMVGIITAYCGPIALVGMSIPILVRIISDKADIQRWIIHSCLLGGISVLLTDVVNQILFNGSMPLNILISMWGVPLMIWLLVRQMKWALG